MKYLVILIAIIFLNQIASKSFGQFMLGKSDASKDSMDDRNIKRGMLFVENNKPKNAQKCFTSALKLYPKNFLLYQYRGIADVNAKEYENAIKDFSEAIDLNPNDANSRKLRAMVYNYRGDFIKALEDLDNAIRLNDKNDSYYYYRADTRRRLGMNKESLADYNRAEELHFPKDDNRALSIYRERGEVETHLQLYKLAIEDLHQYILLKGININANLYLGEAYLGLYFAEERPEEIDSAINYLKKYKLFSNNDSKGLGDLVFAYALLGDSVKVKKELSVLMEGKKDNSYAWFVKGMSEFIMKNWTNGIQSFNNVIKAQPTAQLKSKTYYNLGWLYAQKKDSLNAYTYFDLAQASDSTLSEIYFARSYSSLWFFKGDYTLLKKDLFRQLSHALNKADSSSVYYFLSFAALRRGESNLALEWINRAIELNNHDATIYELRALINMLYRKNYPENIFDDLERAIALDNQYPSAYVQMGYALAYFKKDFQRACEMWKFAIGLGFKIPDECRKALCNGNLIDCNIQFGPTYKKPVFQFEFSSN